MLTFLAHNVRDQRLLVVATYRADDVHREHPLRPLLTELRRSSRLDPIDLAPFTPSAVAENLAVVTEARPSSATVDIVVERTEGNAYLIEELVAADGLTDRSLPESLSELLLIRTETLISAAQRMLRMASVAGRLIDDERGRPLEVSVRLQFEGERVPANWRMRSYVCPFCRNVGLQHGSGSHAMCCGHGPTRIVNGQGACGTHGWGRASRSAGHR
jgi:hypothetical protein